MKAIPYSAIPVEVYKISGLKPAEDYNALELQEWGGRRLSVSRSTTYSGNRDYSSHVEINLIAIDKDLRADTLKIKQYGTSDSRSYYLVKDLFGYINILSDSEFRETYHLLDEEVSV